MSAVAFALIDLVLAASWREAKSTAKKHHVYGHRFLAVNATIYAQQMRQHLGWWRSCWVAS